MRSVRGMPGMYAQSCTDWVMTDSKPDGPREDMVQHVGAGHGTVACGPATARRRIRCGEYRAA